VNFLQAMTPEQNIEDTRPRGRSRGDVPVATAPTKKTTGPWVKSPPSK
jgi:hypothetical protein